MILATSTNALLAGLARTMHGIGVYCIDADGRSWHHGVDLGVTVARAVAGGAATVTCGDGVTTRGVRLADGSDVVAAFPAGDGERCEALLAPLLDLLGRCEQLEQDMESMNHSSLQLLEQVSMLGETLPRLSAGETDEDIALTGLKACIVAASVERAVYLRLQQETGLCEVIAYAELGAGGRVEVRPYPLDVIVRGDEGLCGAVLRTADSVVLRAQTSDDDGLDPSAPENLARREVIGVPVTFDTGDRRVCLGAMLLFDKVSGYDLHDARLGSEEGQVAMSFASMLGAVMGARLSAALGKEMSMAQAIQSQILPAAPARVPGFELAGDYRTSGDVGGDYFDYVAMADGRTLVTVADVSGHNLASGMVMVSARATLRTLAAVRSDPGQVFTDLAASMHDDLTRTERFITAAGVALRPDDHRVEVVNAGHNDLIVYRARPRRVERVPAEQTVLGFVPGTVYGRRELELEPGDCMFLYTDGVTECASESGEMFGEERLDRVVASACSGSAQDVVDAVLTAVADFQAAGGEGDDITIVAIKATVQEAAR